MQTTRHGDGQSPSFVRARAAKRLNQAGQAPDSCSTSMPIRDERDEGVWPAWTESYRWELGPESPQETPRR
jgi:hypothetical protein